MVICSGESNRHWLWRCGSQSVWRLCKARRAAETQRCLHSRRRLGLGKCKYVLVTFRLFGVVAGPQRCVIEMTFLLGKEKGAIGLGSPGSPSYSYRLSKIIHSAPPFHSWKGPGLDDWLYSYPIWLYIYPTSRVLPVCLLIQADCSENISCNLNPRLTYCEVLKLLSAPKQGKVSLGQNMRQLSVALCQLVFWRHLSMK